MKHIVKTIVLAPFLIICLIIVNPHVAKTNSAAPPLGGLSGDPGRSTCALIGCHFGNTGATYSFGPGQLTLNMGGDTSHMTPMAGQSYTPGQTYYIELQPNLANGATPRYGFQMTSLNAAGNMAGAFTIINTRRNSTESLLGRNYIGHSAANSDNNWVFAWTAPPADSATGAITFYLACNMANGDGTNNGDSIYLDTVVLSQAGSSGIFRVENSFENLSIYPNPARDYIFLTFRNSSGSEANISLYRLDGKRIQSGYYNVQHSVTNTIKYNLPWSVTPGIYLLELESGNNRAVQRIAIM